MRILFLLLLIPSSIILQAAPKENDPGIRVRKYAAYKAHTILPETLRFLVKKHSKSLFYGLERGLKAPPGKITDAVIFREADKITKMVNSRVHFGKVVAQMGFVTGLVAVYTDPSLAGTTAVRRGFPYYVNRKLNKCYFVFDGYQSLEVTTAWLRQELARVPQVRADHQRLLEDRYSKAGNNPRHLFDERDAVFGVGSIYFSNLARYSAHLWYYAWGSARGDVTRMPFKKKGVGRQHSTAPK
ncbi:MAG: hypothetical protein QNK37_15550 [Acidobacteriota bacterium]|nr:hypothetical protein [Acidobacteriota bacterium]